MDINYSRYFKVLSGVVLIGVTMTSDNNTDSGDSIYSLVAIPIIFSGIFDWRPAEMFFENFFRYLASLSQGEKSKKLELKNSF